MTPIDTETFGERLRRLRETKGWALATLARRVGLTEATLLQLETGRTREPRLGDGMRLADALGTDARYLAFGDGEPPTVPSELSQRVTVIERRLGVVELRVGIGGGPW
jgi:transcriptional regulator with XRE-family HTH domain